MEKMILVRAMTLKQFEPVVEDEYEGDRTSADLQTQSLKLNRLMGDSPLQEALAKLYKINAEVAELAQTALPTILRRHAP
jgi:hypothetical protein